MSRGKEGSADLVPSRNASPKLVQVLEQLDAADASLKLLQGQDVVVMIGPTGTGKTLVLHAINDRKLKGHRHRQGRLVYEAEMPLAGFDVSHGKASQTKSIQALERDAGNGRKVIYLDSPGFHDTGGAHVDVVTSINLQKVANMAGSLRFCVVISCDSLHTHRGGAIREVAKLLSKFTSDFDTFRYAFTFVFTHADQLEEFPRWKPKTWKQKLHEILREILECTDWSEEYIEVLKWMVQCTDPKASGEDDGMVFVFNPKQPNAQSLRASLENFSSDGGHTRCLHSKVKLTQKTRSWITVEMQRWQESVEACVDGDDIDEVRALLQIADDLARHTDLRDVQEGLSCAVEMISERTAALRKRAVELQQGEAELGKVKDCWHCWQLADRFATLLGGELQPEDDTRWDSNERPQVWLPKMADALKGACAGSAPSDDTILMQLQTLYVWAQADDEFSSLWTAAFEDVQAYLKRSCAQSNESGNEDPSEKAKLLGALEEMLPRLKKLGLHAKGVSAALRRETNAVESMIQQDLARVIAAVEEGTVDPKQLEDFWDTTRAIESPAPWAKQMRRAGQRAEEEFVKFVSEREARLYSSLLHGLKSGDLGCRMREAMEGLKFLQSCWRSPAQGKFLEAVKLTAQKLREMRSTIEALVDFIPVADNDPPPCTHGELAELVSRFEESTCLDEFLEELPEGKDLVEARNGLHSLVEVSKQRSAHQAQEYLENYLTSRRLLPPLRSLIHKWPEAANMVSSGRDLTSVLVDFKDRLKRTLAEPSCPLHLDDKECSQVELAVAADLNKALDFLAAESPEIKLLTEEIAEMVQQYLETASRRIKATFSRERRNYDQKASLLSKLRDCNEHLKSWLPTYESMREAAEALVRKEACYIRHEEDMVIQGQRIEEFQAALVLEEHLTGHVKFLAENLQQAYESRRLDEQGILREAIEELDAKRVQKEVEALSTSEDPTVQKKVEDAVRQFKGRLELQIRQTRIEDTEAVMSIMRVLQAVDEDSVLDVKLSEEGFHADTKYRRLKVQANDHYNNLGSEYNRALDTLDLSMARDRAASLQVYIKVCPEILDEVDSPLYSGEELRRKVTSRWEEFEDYIRGLGNENETSWRDVSRMLLNALSSESAPPSDSSQDPLGLRSNWPRLYRDITAGVSTRVIELVEGLTGKPSVVKVATYRFLQELESQWKDHWTVPYNFEELLQAAMEEEAASWNVLPTPENAGEFLERCMLDLEEMATHHSYPTWTAELNREEFQRKREKFEEHLRAAAAAIRKALRTNDFKTAGLWIKSVFDTEEDGGLPRVRYQWQSFKSRVLRGSSFSALMEALEYMKVTRERLGGGLVGAVKTKDLGSFRLGLEEAERFTQHLSTHALDWEHQDELRKGVHAMLDSWDLPRAGAFVSLLNETADRSVLSKPLDTSYLPQRLEEELKEALQLYDYSTTKKLLAAAAELLYVPYNDARAEERAQELVNDHAAQLVQRTQTSYDNRDFTALRDTMSHLDRFRSAGLHDCYLANAIERVEFGIKADMDEARTRAIACLHSKANAKDLGHDVLLLGRVWDGFPQLKMKAQEDLQRVFNEYEDCPKGPSLLFKLGTLMEQGKIGSTDDDKRIAKTLVHHFRQFKLVTRAMFNSQTEATQKDIPATLAKVKSWTVTADGQNSLEIDSGALNKLFKQYQGEWKKCFEMWRCGQLSQEDLVGDLINRTRKLQGCRVGAWSAELRQEIPRLLGGIFAYVTISKNSEGFDEDAAPEVKKDHVLFKPHPIQVVGILRLLGCDVPGDRLQSQLAQVRTGEGKSLILAALSVLLSLLGFRVRCVCYSAFLSERDFKDFREVLEAFGVLNHVTYSTICDYSEDTIEAKGDLRGGTSNLVQGKASESGAGKAQAPPREDAEEILILDEADMLFGRNFYGKTHNVMAEFPSQEAGELVRFAWNHQHDGLTLSQLKETEAYRKLLEKSPHFGDLFDRELSTMLEDLKKFRTHKYKVDVANTRIGYIVQDTVSYEAVYGYCTAFAYLCEAEKLYWRDPDLAMQRVSHLRIPCGQFSYAKNVNPACILGVSGTIQVLDPCAWQVMMKFGIHQWTYLPSVYGTDKLKFLDQDGGGAISLVDDQDDLFCQVTEQAKSKTKLSRAVIVIFDNDEVVQAYKTSKYARQFGSKVAYLHEGLSHKDKSELIRRAAMAGQVTVASRPFGRGSDFICFDAKVEEGGGVHVVQAFFSEEKSEEVQIQGRTARQGMKGTYSLVLVKSDLQEKFEVDAGTVEDLPPKQLYQELDAARSVKFKADAQRMEEDLARAAQRDEASHKYFDALLDGSSQPECRRLLDELHELVSKDLGAHIPSRRIILLVDATGSMHSLWAGTKSCIEEVLRRIMEIGGSCFDMQIVAYRDYSDEETLETSARTRDAAVLQQFLSGIGCDGGGDHEEAVEHALAYANAVHSADDPVTKVVLIGDAPPHREKKGDELESHNHHTLETDFMLEAEALHNHGIVADCFWLCTSAAASFQSIAESTGGNAWHLDIGGDSAEEPGPEASNQLMDAICESALEDIGGQDLVLEYRSRYKHK